MESNNYKVLIVDDEEDILEFLGYNLRKEGYEVQTASDGIEAIKKAKKFEPHLILLDVMMPRMDGIQACEELKQIPELEQTIIVFLTARSEDYSQIAGFEAGADDYVSKPIKPKVLVSRMKALLRRRYSNSQEGVEENVFSFDNLVIDKEKYVVIRDGKEITLPRKEFELLRLLTSKPDKVFERMEILNKVWGKDVIVGDRTIDVHIRKIRDKLSLTNIKTVKGVGYKFEL